MKTKIELKRINGEIIFSHECEYNSVVKTLDAFRRSGAEFNLSSIDLQNADLGFFNFSGVNLSGSKLNGSNLEHTTFGRANLEGADLNGANLRGSYLGYAVLTNANLIYTNLRGANLCYANLNYANLWCASLSEAHFINAKLIRTNLSDADLSGADLSGADLSGSSLDRANLSNTDLRSANLHNISFSEKTAFLLPQCPSEGSFVAWKEASGKIVKLLVTEDAKRSSATSLKCRCSKAKVLAIENMDGSESELKEVASSFYCFFVYRVGETVEVEEFDDNRWNECSDGIHFFISREMAVKY